MGSATEGALGMPTDGLNPATRCKLRPTPHHKPMSSLTTFPYDNDRVRLRTRPKAQHRIDERTDHNILFFGEQSAAIIRQRLRALDREWDVERVLEANASTLALTGLALGAAVHRRWLWVSAGVLGFLFLHATQGWCPPLPVLRAKGVRTRGEIERERIALLQRLQNRHD